MATGTSYERAAEKWGAEFLAEVGEKGCFGENVDFAFNTLGLVKDRDYTLHYLIPRDASVKFTRNVLWGRRAILQVRSKNYPAESHMVYWNGERLFDPSNRLTYVWEEVEPAYFWLFNDAAIVNGKGQSSGY